MASPLVESLKRGTWFVALMAMVACGPGWQIIKKSGPPSALATVNTVAVSFSYAGMIVGGGAGVPVLRVTGTGLVFDSPSR